MNTTATNAKERLQEWLRSLANDRVGPNSLRHRFLLRVHDGALINVVKWRPQLHWALAWGLVQMESLGGHRYVLTDRGKREMLDRGLLRGEFGDGQ